MIVGFCGLPRVGKDTAADHMVAKHGFTKFHPADAVKDVALLIDPYVDGDRRLSSLVDEVGWTEAKTHKEVRRLLQHIGTEAGRDFHGDGLWVDRTMADIDALPADAPAVVSGVRFQNELDALRRRGGVLVRVLRDVALDAEAASHASESKAALLEAHYRLFNHHTIPDLHDRVDDLLDHLRSIQE